MSFLNSVMSSIGEDSGKASAPKLANIAKKPTPSPKPSTSLTSPAPPRATNGAESLKRKVDQRDGNKLLRVSSSTSATPKSLSPTPSRSKTSSPVQRSGLAPPPRSSEPYRGTVRTASQLSSASTGGKSSNGLGSQKLAPVQTPAAAAASSSASAVGAPKKGYLAILERAKAAQEAAKPFGQIKHQKTTEKERLSRKERERLAAEAALAAKKDARTKGASKATGTARSGTASAGAVNSPEPKKRKVEVEYKGTMRAIPSKPAYTGTMRSGGVNGQRSQSSTKNGRPSKQPSYRYAEDYDDEDEEEEEDDIIDDEDSASSDMEAAMDEIYEEEIFSTRLAKKEDEDALREESELKRQKLERKRKLEALNAAAAKKKKVY